MNQVHFPVLFNIFTILLGEIRIFHLIFHLPFLLKFIFIIDIAERIQGKIN